MPDSRVQGRHAPWWQRVVLALAVAPMAVAVLTAAAAPSPSPSPSPTDTPTPPVLGTLQVIKTDLSGARLVIPGATFTVHRGTPTGAQVTTLTTNNTGVAAKALDPGTYCLEETAAPPGFQVAPNYTPDSGCVAVLPGATAVISVADPPVASTPTPSPTPTPTPMPTGELQITKVDTNNRNVTAPGFTFNVRVGSASGPVIATIATDGSGIAVAGALNPAIYCVEEVSAPEGFQVAPTYTPSNCVSVRPDPTQGRNPTVVTVADPAAPIPTPSTQTAGSTAASPTPGGTGRAAKPATVSALPVAVLSKGLIGFGVVLLLVGAVMIVVATRRRRMRPVEAPTDYWYDSTIS